MPRRLLSIVSMFGLLLGQLPGPAYGQAGSGATIADQYIVALQPSANPRAEAQAAARTQGVRVLHVYEHALRGFAFQGSAQAARALAHGPNVKFVAQDRPVRAADQTLPTGIDRVDADRNNVARIDGVDQRIEVNVAVLDTGIDTAHPDLSVLGGTDCLGGGSSNDGNGHGTHLAGTIGAIDNGSGVVGVAPGARLWAVRVLDNSGNGTWASVICGIDWATATRTDGDLSNDIAVANMSLSGSGSDDGNCGNTSGDALHQAICGSVASGVVYVVAAGNYNLDAASFVPAAYDEVLTVSAIADSDGKPGGLGPSTGSGADDTLAGFSNWGPDVDLAAPGVDVLSLAPGGGTALKSGTSMAAPHVSGGVALYVATNGAAVNAAGVAAIRAAVTDPARGYSVQQADPKGFTGDRDSSAEPLAYVGPKDIRDVAVTGIVVPAEVVQGGSATVEVTVANEGTLTESFGVTLRDATGGTDIGSQSVSGLVAGASRTLSFTWTTSGSTSVGAHLLTATAATVSGETDTVDNSRSATVTIKGTAHVSDLDAASVKLTRSQWKALVTIGVHEGQHQPVASATVSGTFKQGSWTKAVSCTTGSTGRCTVDSGAFPTNTSATFTVDKVVHASLVYAPSANHDPDGDSNGTSISFVK